MLRRAYSLIAKVPGALTLYQSFFAKVSVFFLRPFLPFERRLFLPTAMFATLDVGRGLWCCRVVDRDNSVAEVRSTSLRLSGGPCPPRPHSAAEGAAPYVVLCVHRGIDGPHTTTKLTVYLSSYCTNVDLAVVLSRDAS